MIKDQHVTFETGGVVCAGTIEFDVVNEIVHNVIFHGGCRGNSQGVAAMVEGYSVHDVVLRCRGIPCRTATSCPDQLARACQQVIDQAEQTESLNNER